MKKNNVNFGRLERTATTDLRLSTLAPVADRLYGVTSEDTRFGNDTPLLRSARRRPAGR